MRGSDGASVRNEDVWRFILSNVRQPDHMAGDLHAQMASGEVGAQRLATLCDSHGLDDIEELADEIIERSEAATRETIRALPAATMTPVRCSIWQTAPRRHLLPLDRRCRSGRDHRRLRRNVEASRWGINVKNYTHAYTTFTVRSVLSPDIPNNHARPDQGRSPRDRSSTQCHPSQAPPATSWVCFFRARESTRSGTTRRGDGRGVRRSLDVQVNGPTDGSRSSLPCSPTPAGWAPYFKPGLDAARTRPVFRPCRSRWSRHHPHSVPPKLCGLIRARGSARRPQGHRVLGCDRSVMAAQRAASRSRNHPRGLWWRAWRSGAFWSTATPSRRRNASRSLVMMLFGSNCRAAVATESRADVNDGRPHLRRRMAKRSRPPTVRPSSSSRVLTVLDEWTYAASTGSPIGGGRLHSGRLPRGCGPSRPCQQPGLCGGVARRYRNGS